MGRMIAGIIRFPRRSIRRSIANEKKSTEPKKGRKRIVGQGEMLLPISGKKGKEGENILW
jgi:hypothetical protein